MPQIIIKQRIAHLAWNFFLQEILIIIKTRLLHSSINHQEHLFHMTHTTSYFRLVNAAKILGTAFL